MLNLVWYFYKNYVCDNFFKNEKLLSKITFSLYNILKGYYQNIFLVYILPTYDSFYNGCIINKNILITFKTDSFYKFLKKYLITWKFIICQDV